MVRVSLTWFWKQARGFDGKHETSVISLSAMDIVSHEDPSVTDQFSEALPDLEDAKVFCSPSLVLNVKFMT